MTKEQATREALRMALEALEQSHPEAYRHVITAIKEALAQQSNISELKEKTANHNVDCLCADCSMLDDLEDATAQPEQEPANLFEAFQQFGEGWESLAWELCADENGEEACTELIWEGGPIPEPWGDRWLKYEDEARRLIALVNKHTHPPVPTAQPKLTPLTDEQLHALFDSPLTPTGLEWARKIEAAHGIKEKNT